MKKILYVSVFMCMCQIVAQNTYLNQVLLLNEGCYDFYDQLILEPVTVGVYDPVQNEYNTVIEIDGARFASDLIIHANYFYVAADNKLLKYDLDTYELLASEDVPGVRKMAIFENYLFITKGDYDNATFGPVIFDSYLDVFDLELNYQFSFDTESNGPQWSTESLLIKDENLYIGINNGYEWGNYKGLVGVVDLNSMSYVDEIDLGEDGKNPINLLSKDGQIFTVNNKNWDGSSLSIINESNVNTQTINLSNVSSGCGVSMLRGDDLFYQVSNNNQIFKFDLNNLEESGVIENFEYNYYAMEQDPISGYIYASIANFVSSSGIVVYDQNYSVVNTFFADVATGTIAFDVRTELVSIDESSKYQNNIIKTIDLLGRNVNNDDLIINIYNDHSFDKKYIIK